MRSIIYALLVLALSVPSHAAETPLPPAATTPAVTAPAAAPQKSSPPSLSQTRDAFLAFALDKAKGYTDKAEIAVSKAVDVVSQEAPLAAAEFLRWRAWMHAIKGLTPLLLGIIGIVVFCWQWGKWKAHGDYLTSGTMGNVVATTAGGIVSLISGVVFLAAGAGHVLSFVQISVAPRVYMIEQVMGAFGR